MGRLLYVGTAEEMGWRERLASFDSFLLSRKLVFFFFCPLLLPAAGSRSRFGPESICCCRGCGVDTVRRDAVSWILLSLSHRLVSSSLHNGKHRQTRRERERREEDENRIGLDWIGSGTRWEGLGGVVARVLLLSPAGDQWPGVGNCGAVCAESRRSLFSCDVWP